MELLIPCRSPFPVFAEAAAYPRRRRRQRRRFWFHLLLLTWLGIETSPAQAVSHEYEIKAVFLFNFAKFTTWPTNAFHDADAPFVIGVMGTDPFGGVLDATVEQETYEGRKFVIKRISRVEDAQDCQILFIARSETRRVGRIVAAARGKPVLVVSDMAEAEDAGAQVRFVVLNNKIRLRINLNELKKAGLTMSSQLLSLAQLVPGPDK